MGIDAARLAEGECKPMDTTTHIQPTDGSPSRHFTLMVVEDDKDLLGLYQLQVGQWPMPVDLHLQSRALDALMSLERVQPDMLILDLQMPGIDGFDLLEAIRRNPRLADVVILVVTGLGEEAIKTRGGLPAYIPVMRKPIPFAQIQEMAQGVMRAKHRMMGKSTKP
jgi:CheY-like chemotaxis protein